MNWRLLSVSELSDRTGIHPQAVYRLVRANRIPFLKVGGLIRFRETAIDEWLIEQERKTSGQTTPQKRTRTAEDECARYGLDVNHRFSSYAGGTR